MINLNWKFRILKDDDWGELAIATEPRLRAEVVAGELLEGEIGSRGVKACTPKLLVDHTRPVKPS